MKRLRLRDIPLVIGLLVALLGPTVGDVFAERHYCVHHNGGHQCPGKQNPWMKKGPK